MGKLNFDVDAYTARLIGRENVSRLESAILELVKNTYDADASCCVLYFEASTNTLYLADNGDGMSTEVIRKHWMTIGNSSKKSKYTSGKGRIQTGAKGIGRFALDRIGDKCTMYTRSANENLEWNIDWSSFKDGTPLTEVTAELDSVSYGFTNFVDSALNSDFKKLIAHRFTGTGTVFKISPVRDNWSESFIKNLKLNLSTLIPQEISSFFTIFFYEENTNTDDAELVLSVAEAICDYKISFSVDGDIVRTAILRNEFDFKAQKDKILSEAGFRREDAAYFSGEAIIEENLFSRLMSSGKKTVQNTIGSFSGVFLFSKLNYMDGDREKYYYKNSKQMSLPWSGIRIYRDNFRVRPYGDPDSSAYDWLLLSNRKAKSPAAPSHPSGKWRVSADQICGTILISRTNIGLPDQANREGFVETEEFKLLKSFLLKIIERFERDRQYVFRTLCSYYDITHPTEKFEAEIAKKAMIAAQHLSDSHSTENNSEKPKYGNDGSTKSLASSVDASKAQAVINKKDEQIKALEDENQLLRVLATIGIVTNTYVHEIRANTNNLELKLTMARESLKYDQDIETALRHLGEADNYLQSFGSWFKVTIESVRKDRRTMKQVNISALLNDLMEAWRNTCSDLQIELNCGDIKFRCFPYEIESIFNNLIANSTAAFKSARQHEQRIQIDVNYDGEYLRISYEDNGPGLSPKYKRNPDLILESMETDKTDADGEVVGTGMGMWIIWKTVDEYKGTIDLSENLSDDTGFHIKLSLKGRG